MLCEGLRETRVLLPEGNQSGRRLAKERLDVGRQPVEQGLHNAPPVKGRPGGVGDPCVLVDQRRQREQQPRIVDDVVRTHRRDTLAVGGFESEPEVAAQPGGVTKRDFELMRRVQGAHTRQQRVVAVISELVVRTGQQEERLGVVHEPLTAAARTGELANHRIEPVEVGVRVAVVPDRQRHERQHIEQVVVEQDGRRGRVVVVLAALHAEEMQDVHRNDVFVDAVGFAVPIVQQVKPAFARALIVLGDEPPEPNLPWTHLPDMRAHALAETR